MPNLVVVTRFLVVKVVSPSLYSQGVSIIELTQRLVLTDGRCWCSSNFWLLGTCTLNTSIN